MSVYIYMHISILCLKVEQKQVCEQSVYVDKMYHHHIDKKFNSKIIILTMIIDKLLIMESQLLKYYSLW